MLREARVSFESAALQSGGIIQTSAPANGPPILSPDPGHSETSTALTNTTSTGGVRIKHETQVQLKGLCKHAAWDPAGRRNRS